MNASFRGIGILDYGRGNLGSVYNACRFVGLPVALVQHPEEARACTGLIVPGVGAFGDCLAHIHRLGWQDLCRTWIKHDRPFLGICVGLQALFEHSEENPAQPGLSVFPGRVRKFPTGTGRKVPQMGWNRVSLKQPDCPLFTGIPDGTYFYFVHSYYVDPADTSIVAGMTDYGLSYPSALWNKRCFAMQFHPEKSQDKGLRILSNFGKVVSSAQGVCP